MEGFPVIVKTLFGLESVLAQEMEALGLQNVKILNRAVRFEGTMDDIYLSNLSLRTALNILVPIDEFEAFDEQELYYNIKMIPWFDYLEVDQTFSISATTSSDTFKHSKYVSLKSKDAIVDKFRDKFDQRPSVDTQNPDIEINIHIYNNKVTVSLDSTGLSLDRRGYRLSKNEAPINEVLAAGILLTSEVKNHSVIYDPMCGSGTFSIEAAMIVTNTAPGLNRSFSFQNWSNYEPEVFEAIKNGLIEKQTAPTAKILARDTDRKALDITAENAERANMDEFISLKQEDFFESVPVDSAGIIILNPPYGERLNPQKIEEFYKSIGDVLKQKYLDHEMWIISSNFNGLRALGLKPTSKKVLFNGSLECKLQKYEMYEGSRRAFN